jgi:hypothetical protein
MTKSQFFLGAFAFYGFVGFCREMNWFFAIVFHKLGYAMFF